MEIPEKIQREIDNRKALKQLSKYGNPLFPLGGIVSNNKKNCDLIFYAEYLFLENDDICSWILHNYKIFKTNTKYELFGMDFMFYKKPKKIKMVVIPEKIIDIWNKPIQGYLERAKHIKNKMEVS